MGPLRRVLIANRGEIAIRIAKAADGLGIESVAIYPPADERSLHTRVTTTRHALAATADPIAAYLDVEAVVASLRQRSNASTRSSGRATARMPRPPPPAAALNITG